MPRKMKYATVSLHVSAAVYLLAGLLLLFLSAFANDGKEIHIGAIAVTLAAAMAFLVERVVKGLKQGSRSAWVGAVCLAGLYTPTLFLPLGILMFVGLLDEETTEYCMRRSPAAAGTANQ